METVTLAVIIDSSGLMLCKVFNAKDELTIQDFLHTHKDHGIMRKDGDKVYVASLNDCGTLDLYSLANQLHCRIDHQGHNLHILDDAKGRQLIDAYKQYLRHHSESVHNIQVHVKTFKDESNGEQWYSLPFKYPMVDELMKKKL